MVLPSLPKRMIWAGARRGSRPGRRERARRPSPRPTAIALAAADPDRHRPQAIGGRIVPSMLGELERNIAAIHPEMQTALHETSLAILPEFDKAEASVLNDLAHVLASRMTEQELRETQAFFEGPTGKKYLASQPAILQELGVAGNVWRRQLSTDMLDSPARGNEEEGLRVLTSRRRSTARASAGFRQEFRCHDDFDVDLFVIGAGSGGVRAARIAAGPWRQSDDRRGIPHRRNLRHPRLRAEETAGLRQPLRRRVPRRRRIRLERRRDPLRLAETGRGQGSRDHPALRRSIAPVSKAPASRSSRQRAVVAGPQRVRLADGREISARHILDRHRRAAFAACPASRGSSTPSAPTRFSISQRFPQRLLVVGGGYIAVEFASLFRRLGAEVVEVMRADNILRGFDEDMRAGLRDEMARAGVQFGFGRLPTRIVKPATGLAVEFSDGADARVRSGPDRDRPRAQYRGARAGDGRRQARRCTAPSSSMRIRPPTFPRSTRSAT